MQQLHQQQHQFRSIFDVVSHLDSLTSGNAAAFKRIFRVTSASAKCCVGPELAAKYQVQENNVQQVVSITNMHTLEQTWFNQARTTKPQTFTNSSVASIDPTNNGANCDFCSWQTLTARDPGFGRIQLPHAVTGSNLFKYVEPSHGVVLFKHHDPLTFSQAALSDLLDASWLWFQESHKLNPHATQPYLLWNCLPRAGASQYHGHAQVMLSSVPVPGVSKLQRAAAQYQQQHPDCCYYADLLSAHAAVGLVRQVSIAADPALLQGALTSTQRTSSSQPSIHTQQPQQGVQHSRQAGQQPRQHVAWGFASLVPVKDQEVVVVGSHLCCPAFQRMVHAALRGLIDGLGSATFNLGVLNLDLSAPAPAGVGLGRLFWPSQAVPIVDATGSSSNGGDSCGSNTSNGNGVYSNNGSGSVDGLDSLWLPDADYWGRSTPPVVARLASRGKLSSAASDFGGLEVWGGASIGHTDPFTVVQQLDVQLAAGAGSPDGYASLQAN